jgi:cation diffusion facilitator CzcD-associated flavoprotein CzcO
MFYAIMIIILTPALYNKLPRLANLSEHSLDVAVIGAGPQALTLMAYLLQKRPNFRSRLRVFDPSGGWLRQWQQQFASYEIPHLRSPAVHHPSPDAGALRRFAESRPPDFHAPADLPGTGLFQDFCAATIGQLGLQNAVEPAAVTALQVLGKRSFKLTLSHGETVQAKRVVVATGGGKPALPECFQCLSTDYPADRLQHSSQVDLRQMHCAGARILIVGGGLTSGHLAIGAVQRQAQVTLMHRRQFYDKLFDADPGWLGPKYLNGFHAEPCWQNRAQAVLTARDGGSMTPAVFAQLRRHRTSGQVEFQEDCQVEQVEWSGDHWQVRCSHGRQSEYDRIWLATGSQLNVMQHPLLSMVQVTHPTEVVRGLPVLDRHLRWPGLELFVMGGLAGLQVGPTARNLSGARMASDRITPALIKASLQLVA